MEYVSCWQPCLPAGARWFPGWNNSWKRAWARAVLAALAASFMGWQLSMTLFGYLHDIVFAGQSAVENYKARARVLRMQENPLGVLQEWEAQCTDGILTLYGPQGTVSQHQGYTA